MSSPLDRTIIDRLPELPGARHASASNKDNVPGPGEGPRQEMLQVNQANEKVGLICGRLNALKVNVITHLAASASPSGLKWLPWRRRRCLASPARR